MRSLLQALHTRLVFGRRVCRLGDVLSDMIPAGSRVLDVGCGDGQISVRVVQRGENISVEGIDVLLRPKPHILVTQFDGITIPFANSSFDVVMLVDVLHHTTNPEVLLAEAKRVTKRYILLKDHFQAGLIDRITLKVMDWIGNVHHGVVLSYNYLTRADWIRIYAGLGLQPVNILSDLHLYPQPADLIFGRGLHFIALLEKQSGAGCAG